MKFLVPTGIGDICWALTKIQSIAGGQPIDVDIACADPNDEIEMRALPFVRNFTFVRNAQLVYKRLCCQDPDPEFPGTPKDVDDEGLYRYIPSGPNGDHFILIANGHLEKGERLEQWLPEYRTDWSFARHFQFTDKYDSIFAHDCWEHAKQIQLNRIGGDFAIFYLGPERGNVDAGHNRGFLWEPSDWVTLGKACNEAGLRVVVVGANYDRSYWERYVQEGVAAAGMKWLDLIGKLHIAETFALCQRSKFVVAYQSGIAIFSHYLGCKVATWWRRKGDSIRPDKYLSFHEAMATAWNKPGTVENGTYLPLIYKRETVTDVIEMMRKRRWLR